MTREPVIRATLRLVTLRFVSLQIGLLAIVGVLAAMWLQIPDARVIDLVGTVVLGLLILVIAGAGESWLMLFLVSKIRSPARLLRGCGVLLAGTICWFALRVILEHLHTNASTVAGYLNSICPRTLRNILSYRHITQCLGWMWTTLQCVVAGGIVLLAFAAVASDRASRAARSSARCLTYWVTLVVGAFLTTFVVGTMASWTPGHGIRTEAFSFVVRFGLSISIVALIVNLLLAILAVCSRTADAVYETRAGIPAEIQPRTVEKP